MTIPVFYSISDDFAKYAAVSLNSLVKFTSPENDYTVIFLHQDVSEEHQKALSAYEKKNVHIQFHKLDDKLMEPIQKRSENYLRAEMFAPAIFYRLFIPDLFPQYDKAVYIDSDTVLNDDVAKLYDTDLGNNLIGACNDISVLGVDKAVHYIKDILLINPKEYINSGVLVMNAKAFRDEKFLDHFFYLLGTYHCDCLAPDQDYLNEICSGRIKYLDKRWDAMPGSEDTEMANPGLIHYNLFFKPWHFTKVQYEKYFWENAKETVFYDEIKSILDNFSEADRKNELAKMDGMLGKVDPIEKSSVNWKSVKEKEKLTL